MKKQALLCLAILLLGGLARAAFSADAPKQFILSRDTVWNLGSVSIFEKVSIVNVTDQSILIDSLGFVFLRPDSLNSIKCAGVYSNVLDSQGRISAMMSSDPMDIHIVIPPHDTSYLAYFWVGVLSTPTHQCDFHGVNFLDSVCARIIFYGSNSSDTLIYDGKYGIKFGDAGVKPTLGGRYATHRSQSQGPNYTVLGRSLRAQNTKPKEAALPYHNGMVPPVQQSVR
jgi:hypothetical protein